MSSSDKTAVLAALSEKIKRLEQAPQTIGPRRASAFSFGLPPIDQTLAGVEFPFPGLHEIYGQTGEADFSAANAFVAAIGARLKGGILWCVGRSQVYGPAISSIGLSLNKIYFFNGQGDDTILAAMEEGLRHGSLGAVVGEVSRMSLNASRRLILASEKSGVPVFVLRPPITKKKSEHVACGTRWRVSVAPSLALPTKGIGRHRWLLELLRCRASRSGQWLVEAPDAKGHFNISEVVAGRVEAAPFGAQQRKAI